MVQPRAYTMSARVHDGCPSTVHAF